MAHRLISIIGSRPDIVQAGPLSLAFADLCRRGARSHRTALRPGDVGAADRGHAPAAPRLQPRGGLAPQREERRRRPGPHLRGDPEGGPGCDPGPGRHQFDARRRPGCEGGGRSPPPCRGRPAQLPGRHARGAKPGRGRPHLGSALCSLRTRSRGARGRRGWRRGPHEGGRPRRCAPGQPGSASR